MRKSPIPCLLALLALLSLGACASTGMVRTEPASEPGSATVPETRQPQPEPEPDPEPEPESSAPCIPTHDGSCVSAEDFATETQSLAEEYREHPNFKTQWGLRLVNADYAYGHLNQIKGEDVAPGAGVTIGFIDTGIDQHHPDFAGKTITEHFLLRATDETGHRFSHGTAVASVAAAIRSLHDKSAHGVAWGADIAMFAIPTGSGGGPYVPITLQGLAGQDLVWAGLFNYVLVPRPGVPDVDVLNLSIGHPGIIDSYSEQDLRANLGQTIATMAQAGAEEKIILVWAAGNAHGDECAASTDQCENGMINAVSVEVLPGLVARIDELQGHSIAVVALSPDGEIAAFSNRCGIAADFCIAAPGEGIVVAYYGPDPDPNAPDNRTGRGTSYAAPMVAGGLAVMKQLFRDQLSNTELVTRLFETADDEGVYADRAVYGTGAMDLRAATWPVGVLDVPIESSRAAGPGAALLGTRLQAGAAFGDGPERSLAGAEIAAFDDLGAPFWFDLGDFTTGAAARSMTAEVHEFPAPVTAWSRTAEAVHWRIGYRESPGDAGDGHLALAERALTLTLADRHALSGTVFTTEGVAEQPPASGAALAWRPTDSPLGLRAGWMHERETLLGSSADGAFGTLSADAAFVGIEADAELGGWRIGADAEVGTVHSAPRDGIVTGISPLTTTAFTLHASTAFAGDGSLRLSVAQPLRVERGRAALSVPAGRTKDGAVVRSPVAADLAPSGRQIDVAAQWEQPLSIGTVRLGAVVTHQPGHRAAADPQLMFLSGWRWAY